MVSVQDFLENLNDLQIVGLILLLNAIAAVIYLLFKLWKRQWKAGLLLCVFMLATPVVGPLNLLLAEMMVSVQKLFSDREINMEDLSFDQRRVRVILDADMEKERNVVPVEEMLIVSDKSSKRETFLEALKEEQAGSLGVIRNAIEDQDMEIAHYAATYVADTITRAKERERTLRETFEADLTRESCDAYTRYLQSVLEKGIFDGVERRRYLAKLEQAYLWQLENSSQSCSIQTMTGIARQWMKMGDMDGAKQWIDRVRSRCYEDLDAFKVCAAYDYHCHDRAALMELLEKVRSSALELDSEALDWIRFFQKPAEAEE